MTQVKRFSAESQPQKELVSSEEMRKIIVDGDAEVLINCAERIGRKLKEMNLATHQIRGILGDIHMIEMTWPSNPAEAQRELRLLKPKLAYQSKKVKETLDGQDVFPVEELREVICRVIDMVLEQPDEPEAGEKANIGGTERHNSFRRFLSFFEAIVAYHRYHGGRD